MELTEPDYDGLRKFLIEENQFGADRVEKQIERLKACRKQQTQMRLDNCFSIGKKEIKENEKFDPFASKRSAPGPSSNAKKPRKAK
jgi:flap endonuclease-1